MFEQAKPCASRDRRLEGPTESSPARKGRVYSQSKSSPVRGGTIRGENYFSRYSFMNITVA